MANNWNSILSNTNNLRDVLVVLQKVLSLLDNKVDLTVVNEALENIDGMSTELQQAINDLLNNDFMEPFATEEELLKSTPTLDKKAAKALDTKKVWLWDGTRWNDTGLSEYDLAKSDLNSKVGRSISKIIPIVVDNEGNTPLWLKDGRLAFASIDAQSASKVADGINVGLNRIKTIIPIVVDETGNIAVWLEKGKLNFAGISEKAVEKIHEKLNIFNNFPVLSDSKSLYQWASKVAKLKTGQTQQLSVVITGDSWTEHNTITNQILPILRNNLGELGSGWINIGTEQNMLDSISISKTGTWSIYDLDTTTDLPTYGCGPDGFSATSSVSGSKITLGNLEKGNQLTIFYGNSGGTFSYKLNALSAVDVVSQANDDNVKSVTLTGLTDISSLELEVKSGTVAIHGFHLRKTTGSGVEINKCGNGGSTGDDYIRIAPDYLAKYAEFLNPDVVVIILGTNDYRLGKTVESYKSGVEKIIQGYRSIKPNCGIILMIPSLSNGTQTTKLSDLRDAALNIASEYNCAFYNAFNDWSTYQIENANGQWRDSYHVSDAGAYRIAKKLTKLLEV